jgi:hypothetical protein
MDCDKRESLLATWLAEHDRLCEALEEYVQKLAIVPLEQFERSKTLMSTARSACDGAMEALHHHMRSHGCSNGYQIRDGLIDPIAFTTDN